MKNTKNWYRLVYIALCLAGAAVYIALFALKPKTAEMSFSLLCLLLGPLVFFVGTIAYNIVRMFAKKEISNWVLLGMGVLTTILFGIGAHAIYKDGGIASVLGAGSDVNKWYAEIFISLGYIGHLIVYALMPLGKGINKTLVHTAKEVDDAMEQKRIRLAAEEAERQRILAEEEAAAALAAKKKRKPRTPKPKPEEAEQAPEPVQY